MPNDDLAKQLLADAERYDPNNHARSLLSPFRDAILVQRAKYMSYEQIAATFSRHGIKISPAAVGAFCRRNYTRADIERARRVHLSSPFRSASAAPSPVHPPPSLSPRGPTIARDHL